VLSEKVPAGKNARRNVVARTGILNSKFNTVARLLLFRRNLPSHEFGERMSSANTLPVEQHGRIVHTIRDGTKPVHTRAR